MTALRIGVLGAARIAADGIVDPARILGHRLVAVAARDRSRAEAFAAEHGVERVHDSYADVIADPEVDLVYNALVNSEHTRWNLLALRAGKNVLSEKPMAVNADEAVEVESAAAAASGILVEGFHYLHHPVNLALRELVVSGALGTVQRVEIDFSTPSPPDGDPRWSYALGGGATMDLGCYVLHAARQFGRWVGGAPQVLSVSARLRQPRVDAAMTVELGYPDGIGGTAVWDMAAEDRVMTWTVTGSAATATSTAFAVPHYDPRLVVTRGGRTTEQSYAEQTSYTWQLAALAAHLQDGADFGLDVADAVANARLIDTCYRRAGLVPRGE